MTRPGAFSDLTKELAAARNAGRCERCNRRQASEFHHRRPRRMGGAGRKDERHTSGAANCLCLCLHCHDTAERRQRRKAIEDGVILGRTQIPGVTPVIAYMGGRYGAWFLHDDGQYFPATLF